VTNAGFTVSGMTGGYGGNVTITLDLNGTDALEAGAIYTKEVLLHSSRKYNLQLGTDGAIDQLYVAAVS